MFYSGCTKDNYEVFFSRTLIVYMVADNNLSMEAYKNINEIIEGFPSSIGNNRLVIYFDPMDTNPQLIEIGNRYNGTKNVIKDYPEQNSLNSLTMKEIFLEIIKQYPSESYSLILWSHGTSWLPPNTVLKSFGVDNNEEMDIVLY